MTAASLKAAARDFLNNKGSEVKDKLPRQRLSFGEAFKVMTWIRNNESVIWQKNYNELSLQISENVGFFVSPQSVGMLAREAGIKKKDMASKKPSALRNRGRRAQRMIAEAVYNLYRELEMSGPHSAALAKYLAATEADV